MSKFNRSVNIIQVYLNLRIEERFALNRFLQIFNVKKRHALEKN